MTALKVLAAAVTTALVAAFATVMAVVSLIASHIFAVGVLLVVTLGLLAYRRHQSAARRDAVAPTIYGAGIPAALPTYRQCGPYAPSAVWTTARALPPRSWK